MKCKDCGAPARYFLQGPDNLQRRDPYWTKEWVGPYCRGCLSELLSVDLHACLKAGESFTVSKLDRRKRRKER